ncbi:MAG: glycosyltransferase family 25 protein [Eikenella sp.]|nr:glycosyltransferase family 25 protein [Eikenella sp.]
MIPVYIISLADETKRREHMHGQCRRFGLAAVFIDAVDMRQASQADIERLSAKPMHRKPKKQRWLSRGEVGCALSHHRVYEAVCAQAEPYALVLEDDAEFIRNPLPLLDEGYLNALSAQYPFDVLIVGYVKTLPQQLPYYYRRLPVKYRAAMDADGGTVRFGTPWAQYGCGAVAYIVSCAGAEKLRRATQTPCVPADDWLYFEQHHGLRILHSRPAFVLEALEKLDSTIRIEKADFLRPKTSSVIIRSLKGYLKHFAMNYLGMKT